MKLSVAMGWMVALALPAAASGINGVNGAMPNRLSMTVTVARQTQGKSFGESVNTGLHAAGSAATQGAMRIDIACDDATCAIIFPGGDGVHADLAALQLSPLGEADRRRLVQPDEPQARASRRMLVQGAALVGGAMPAAGIVSAAVSSMGKPGGMASSSYAAGRMADAGQALPSRSDAHGDVTITQPLADGDYAMVLVVEKATSGLKDTLKTNVRMASPSRQVRIALGFAVQDGAMRLRHDTLKNAISNVR